MMSRLFILIFWAALGFACSGAGGEANESTNKGQEYSIIHYNITIAPDLSNRMDKKLYPKPIGDEIIVHSILDNIYPSILNTKRSENQKDKIRFSFINNMLISRYQVPLDKLQFDFGSFKNQKARIDYLKDRTSGNTFSKDLDGFKLAYDNLAQAALKDPHGADLWTYLNSRVDDGVVVLPEEKPIQFDGSIYRNIYKNVLILITDGYIEAGLYSEGDCPAQNTCYYLSSNRIAKFRNDFLKSGEQDLATFFKKNQYGIVPLSNPHLQNLEILVLELYDRSLSKGGNATVHPTDKEIIQLFWSDWFEKSGVKNFKLAEVASSGSDVEKVILDFLRVEKRS